MADTRDTTRQDVTRPGSSWDKDSGHDANRDAITGTPGSHPVGTGIGAAGAGAAGAAIGAVAGPVGAAIGAVIGAVAGGFAGKGAAEAMNPTDEDAYWRENYKDRDYVDANTDYDTYRPAYQYGWESKSKHTGRTFDEAESDLRKDWETNKSHSKLGWDKAKNAAKDAWQRVDDKGQSSPRSASGVDASGYKRDRDDLT